MLAAPFAPFITDRIFCDLNAVSGRHTDESVHLSTFPKADLSLIDNSLEERMDLAQKVSSMVLALRRKVSIKVRQPLMKILIPVLDPAMAGADRRRQESHHERGERQGDRTHREHSRSHHKAHQTQLQDPRPALREADEADRRPGGRILPGADRRNRMPHPKPYSTSPGRRSS